MSDRDIFLQADGVRLEFPFNGNIVRQMPVGGEILRTKTGTKLVAVNDVSLRLEAGDSLALLGHNGSGKTTLLRILAGIFVPTSGHVQFRGTLGNALNTNLGFRNEVTGRRNIALKAIVSGYKRSQIPALIEDVEDFAELGPFLDQPLYTYSAGMRARLTFGVATAIKHDILILDEWLSAGDQQMQDRVKDRMHGFVQQASITVLASHTNNLLRQVCNKGIIMEHGRAIHSGDIESVISTYEEQIARKPR